MEKELYTLDSIAIEGSFVVKVKCQAGSEFLRVEADSNLLPFISTKVVKGHLLITPITSICTDRAIKIYLHVNSFKRFFSDGANDIIIRCRDQKVLSFDLTGATHVQLIGNGLQLDARVGGASTFDSRGAGFEHINVKASEASTVTVSPKNYLKASAYDAAEVFYTLFSGKLIKDVQDGGGISPIEIK